MAAPKRQYKCCVLGCTMDIGAPQTPSIWAAEDTVVKFHFWRKCTGKKSIKSCQLFSTGLPHKRGSFQGWIFAVWFWKRDQYQRTSDPDKVSASYFVFKLPFWKSFLALCKANVAKATIVSACFHWRCLHVLPERSYKAMRRLKKIHMKAMRVDCFLSSVREIVCCDRCARALAFEAPPSSEKGAGSPTNLHLKGQRQKRHVLAHTLKVTT